MTEPLSPAELGMGSQIRLLAEGATQDRDPNGIVRAVVAHDDARRQSWLLPAAAASTLLALIVAVVAVPRLLNQEGSSPATAQVGGVSYSISIARSIDLSDAQLAPFASATQNSGFVTDGVTAYQVDDLDPAQVLAMKLLPGQHDDAGSIGSYLVLVRGRGFSLLCDYFADGDPLAPTVCH